MFCGRWINARSMVLNLFVYHVDGIGVERPIDPHGLIVPLRLSAMLRYNDTQHRLHSACLVVLETEFHREMQEDDKRSRRSGSTETSVSQQPVSFLNGSSVLS